MSLPSVPLVPTTNDPQGVGHPNTVTSFLTVANPPVGGTPIPGADASVIIVQNDRTTTGSSAVLELSGGLGADGAAGGSKYTFLKCCGPSGDGLQQDHLQLFRYGPTGTVGSSGGLQVLDIAPKMLPADPLLPAANLVTLYADLQVTGALSSTRGSFAATNPPFDTSAAVGYNTMVLAGFRFIWGRVTSNQGGANPGFFAAIFPSSLVSLNVDGSIKGCVSFASVVASDTGNFYGCQFVNGGRVVGTNAIVDGFARGGAGPAEAVSIVYLVIATAA